MKKRVLVLLAPGAEEMETTIIVDVLRRAELDVCLAGVLGAQPVTCSRGVRLLPDAGLDELTADLQTFGAVVLPGGAKGAECLAASTAVGEVLRKFWSTQRLVAAMCAGPLALASHAIAPGATITSFPGVRERLTHAYDWSHERVVCSGPLVTSQGPGTTFEFALELVKQLAGAQVAERVRGPLLLPEATPTRV